ncbi:helix-turn-helix domain-containing protein [Lichenifustis flavocetrariae]|uniref:AraC family transcriptional regulator n=1 Tax=Lichenifustis flavocetrariae TaxID=2949735 RepID=A0AA41Z7S0_9HYPH|nr:AraC family transcriptional regulator [Lichenifustis flavocetrariae]MCW6512053.1 AraC family transcriptional regulator [Lichenifustis flavocetrariae]
MTHQAPEPGFYGRRISEAFHLDASPTLVTRALKKAPIAVTELRCAHDGLGITSPIIPEEAFAVAVQLQPYAGRLWVAGRRVSMEPMIAGSVSVYDLEKSTIADLQTSFRCLQFYLPQAAIDTVARDVGARPAGGLRAPTGGSLFDPVVLALGQSLLPSLAEPKDADVLFVDHVSWALSVHMCRAYGALAPRSNGKRPILTLRQERMVKAAMDARLGAEVTLSELADLCGLSVQYFARAFAGAVGMPPYQWLQLRRLNRAKDLLVDSRLGLAEVALACGFGDQSHFTKSFTREVGISPGAWRRHHQG